MIRRATIIGTVALGLVLTAPQTLPVYGRLVTSAQNFRHYFCDLKATDSSLSPVERFVFSLMLANSKTAPPDRRT